MRTLTTLLPISQRAKNRIREHGSRYQVIRRTGSRILVESLEHTTWNPITKEKERWLGWFVLGKDVVEG